MTVQAPREPLTSVLTALTARIPDFPRASCVGRLDLSWLPDDETSPEARRAATLCCSCPHVAACAAWAIAHPEVTGVWGGLTTEQRQALAVPATAAS